MNELEVEKVSNRLKGVASILSAVGEVQGGMVWQEWGMSLLADELEDCINKLDDMLDDKPVEQVG